MYFSFKREVGAIKGDMARVVKRKTLSACYLFS